MDRYSVFQVVSWASASVVAAVRGLSRWPQMTLYIAFPLLSSGSSTVAGSELPDIYVYAASEKHDIFKLVSMVVVDLQSILPLYSGTMPARDIG